MKLKKYKKCNDYLTKRKKLPGAIWLRIRSLAVFADQRHGSMGHFPFTAAAIA